MLMAAHIPISLTGELSLSSLPNLEETLKLIEIISKPGYPSFDVQQAQKIISDISSSPQGWQYALRLLDSTDNYARFHGASILRLKIVREWESIQDQLPSLIDRLTAHFVHFVSEQADKFVIRKLCTAIAAALFRSSAWIRALGPLVSALSHQSLPCLAIDQTVGRQDILDKIERLDVFQMYSLFEFSKTLAEEFTTSEPFPDTSKDDDDERLLLEMADSLDLTAYVIEHPQRWGTSVLRESVLCFQAWCELTFSPFSIDQQAKKQRSDLISLLIERIGFEEEQNAWVSGALQDVLERFSGLATREQLLALALKLTGPQTSNMISFWQAGNDNEGVTTYINLLMAYSEIVIDNIVEGERLSDQMIWSYLYEIIKGRGYPGVNDEIATRVLGLWISLVEAVADRRANSSTASSSRQTELEKQSLEVLWLGITRSQWPSDNQMKAWDGESLEGFKAFRTDIEELAQTVYVIHGTDLFRHLAQRAKEAHSTGRWAESEACLWIINALAESSALHEDTSTPILADLFGSQLFQVASEPQLLADPAFLRLNKAKIKLITVYADFFLRSPDYLLPVLELLFEGTKDSKMDLISAKAISKVCSACRALLTPKVDTFLGQCLAALQDGSAKQGIQEDLVSATAYIIQTMSTDEAKCQALYPLIQNISRVLDHALQLASTDEDAASTIAQSCLELLLHLGKALRQPDDDLVEINNSVSSVYWLTGDGRHLQSLTLDIISQAARHFDAHAEIMELCCQVIRVGVNEHRPGAFVFSWRIIVEFLERTTLRTSRLDYVIETTGTIIAKQSSNIDLHDACIRILTHLMRLLATSEDHHEPDPELAAAVLDFASRMTPRNLSSLLSSFLGQEQLFHLALVGLKAPEGILKQSAAHFWAVFVQRYDLEADLQAAHDAALAVYIPPLAHELAFQIGGVAQRHQLDALAEPIKKLVFARAVSAKKYLEASITDPKFPSRKLTGTEKRVWLTKVMNVRGGRQTNVLVKEFWSKCSGG